MEYLQTVVTAAGVRALLRPLGSLDGRTAAGQSAAWERPDGRGRTAGLFPVLLHALQMGSASAEMAEAIVAAAVPEEGEIHPQRAWARVEQHEAVFVTPAGVEVRISSTRWTAGWAVEDRSLDTYCVDVRFYRRSDYLAGEMLAQLRLQEGDEAVVDVDGLKPDDDNIPAPFRGAYGVREALARHLLAGADAVKGTQVLARVEG